MLPTTGRASAAPTAMGPSPGSRRLGRRQGSCGDSRSPASATRAWPWPGAYCPAEHDEKDDFYRCRDADRRGGWVRRFPNDREMEYGAGPRANPLIREAGSSS